MPLVLALGQHGLVKGLAVYREPIQKLKAWQDPHDQINLAFFEQVDVETLEPWQRGESGDAVFEVVEVDV